VSETNWSLPGLSLVRDPWPERMANGVEHRTDLKCRLLLVGTDQDTADSLAGAFRSLPLEIRRACDAAEALSAIRSMQFHLLMLDSTLPGIKNLEFVRLMRAEDRLPPFILFGNSVTLSLAVEAMRLGAMDVLTTPFDLGQLYEAVCRVLWARLVKDAAQAPCTTVSTEYPIGNASQVAMERRRVTIAERLAVYIVNMISCEEDPKTTSDWSKHVHASSSTIRECCRLVHVKPLNARDLGRVIRAVYRSGAIWLPELVLDCSDVRTLKKMMDCAGLSAQRGIATPSALEVLQRQKWIPQDHSLITAVDSLLRQMPVMAVAAK
jgi:DNA-binding response OmpR family regulator